MNIFSVGIPPHVDTHSPFEDGIVSLSLGSQVQNIKVSCTLCVTYVVCLPTFHDRTQR